MPRFAVRIELDGPPAANVYTDLHEAMRKIGFEREIQASDGQWYKLPDATYVGYYETTDVSIVRDHVQLHVSAVWHRYEIVVFRYDEAAWFLYNA